MGGVLFPDRSGATVHLQYLLLIEDWQRAGRFAWGEAFLSYLYREMGRSALHITHSSTSLGGDLGGWLALLQLWAWERFPHMTPRHSKTRAQIAEDASHVVFDGFRPTLVNMVTSYSSTSCGLTRWKPW
ncbi:unnamed protein product, partial [Linum tenue]